MRPAWRIRCAGVALLGLALACENRAAPIADAAPPPSQSQPSPPPSGANSSCVKDADCVRAECCHARSCVRASAAPSCAEIVCTADVQPGTLDVGRCICRAGHCAADIARTEGPLPQ